MARKPNKPHKPSGQGSNTNEPPASPFPPRFRAPHELRVVSSKLVRGPNGEAERVPHIAISGKWLEDRGFPAGVEFVVLADSPNQIVLALTDVD